MRISAASRPPMMKKANDVARYRWAMGMLSIVRSRPMKPVGWLQMRSKPSFRSALVRSTVVATCAILLEGLEIMVDEPELIPAHRHPGHAGARFQCLGVRDPAAEVSR